MPVRTSWPWSRCAAIRGLVALSDTPGAVIGSDGFGLANDEGAWVKIPQIGRAVLGDDVEVGRARRSIVVIATPRSLTA